MSGPQANPSEDPRYARVYPDPQMWHVRLPEEWNSMSEDDRQRYIYEVAIDTGKAGFKYEEVPK